MRTNKLICIALAILLAAVTLDLVCNSLKLSQPHTTDNSAFYEQCAYDAAQEIEQADAYKILYGEYTSECETQQEPLTNTYALYEVPLSAQLQVFIFDNCRSLDPRLIIAVIACESGYNPDNGKAKGSRCVGLMGIDRVYNAERFERLGCSDWFNAYDNVLIGIDILSEFVGKYGLEKGLTCYRWGQYSKQAKAGSCGYAAKVIDYTEGLK